LGVRRAEQIGRPVDGQQLRRILLGLLMIVAQLDVEIVGRLEQ